VEASDSIDTKPIQEKEMNPIQLLQQSLNLKPDGVIGRITFGALRMKWNITGVQLCHLLGQCEAETGGFLLWNENLNYSAAGLRKTFAKYYQDELLAVKHQRKPSVIANHVYGGRMGNLNPNDGFHFLGRGAIQLTGRDNYTKFSQWKKDPTILTHPDLVAGVYAMDSALWFFEANRIWRYTKDLSNESILKVSRAVNVGNAMSEVTPHGMPDRIKNTLKYQSFI
jgi:putative chitinase